MNKPYSCLFNFAYEERLWLKTRGKQRFVSFNEKELAQLRKYFQSLDQQNSGSIGVMQLYDPFIAFGICQNRKEVAQLIQSVDFDGSGKIQFDEFLRIMLRIKRQGKGVKIKSFSKDSKNAAIYKFFEKFQDQNLDTKFNKDISFKLNVSQFRRQKLLDFIMSKNKQKKQAGQLVMENFKKQIMQNTKTRNFFIFSKNSKIVCSNIQIRKKFTTVLS